MLCASGCMKEVILSQKCHTYLSEINNNFFFTTEEYIQIHVIYKLYNRNVS